MARKVHARRKTGPDAIEIVGDQIPPIPVFTKSYHFVPRVPRGQQPKCVEHCFTGQIGRLQALRRDVVSNDFQAFAAQTRFHDPS